MDKAIEQLIAGFINFMIVAGGLWLNGIRQKQAREKQSADLQSEMMRALKTEIESQNTRISKLENENSQLRGNLDEQLEAAKQERLYYRETITDIREDSRNLQKIALQAQKQYEDSQREKTELTDSNRVLNAAVASQREQIVRLETQLNDVIEERNRLIKQLETLQNAQIENARLQAEIESLKAQIREKSLEIERLTAELKKVNPTPEATNITNINPAMVLTAPESAIKPEAKQ